MGQVLTPGALEALLDGARTSELQRGGFEPIVDTRHASASLSPGSKRHSSLRSRPDLTPLVVVLLEDPDPSMAYAANIARRLSNAMKKVRVTGLAAATPGEHA